MTGMTNTLTPPRVSVHLSEGAKDGVVEVFEEGDRLWQRFTLPAEELLPALPRLLALTTPGEDVPERQGNAGVTLLGLVAAPAIEWKVNGLSTFGYALHERDNCRVAIGVWGAEKKLLRYQSDRREPDAYWCLVPERMVVGLWEGENLYVGGMFLSTESAMPNSPHDPNGVIRPWHLGNCDSRGAICFGTAGRPQFGLDGVTSIHDTFFAAAFNDDIPHESEDYPERSYSLHTMVGLLGESQHEDEDAARDENTPVELNLPRTRKTIQQALSDLARTPW